MPVRLVIADDHLLVREGVRRLLEADPDLEVAAVCGDLDSLLAAVESEQPDVVVTDIRMPPGNSDEGIQAARTAATTNPDIGRRRSQPVRDAELRPRAPLEGGSAGRSYLLKERVQDPEQLGVGDPRGRRRRLGDRPEGRGGPRRGGCARRGVAAQEPDGRERDVLREMAAGKSNAAIGESLFLAERSVEKVIHSIFFARAHLGAVGQQAGQGRDPLPRGERLATSRHREEPATVVRPPSDAIVTRPPSASIRSCAAWRSVPRSHSATTSKASAPSSARRSPRPACRPAARSEHVEGAEVDAAGDLRRRRPRHRPPRRAAPARRREPAAARSSGPARPPRAAGGRSAPRSWTSVSARGASCCSSSRSVLAAWDRAVQRAGRDLEVDGEAD